MEVLSNLNNAVNNITNYNSLKTYTDANFASDPKKKKLADAKIFCRAQFNNYTFKIALCIVGIPMLIFVISLFLSDLEYFKENKLIGSILVYSMGFMFLGAFGLFILDRTIWKYKLFKIYNSDTIESPECKLG